MASVQLAPGIMVQDFVADAFLKLLREDPAALAALAEQAQTTGSVQIAPNMPIAATTLDALATYYADDVATALQGFSEANEAPPSGAPVKVDGMRTDVGSRPTPLTLDPARLAETGYTPEELLYMDAMGMLRGVDVLDIQKYAQTLAGQGGAPVDDVVAPTPTQEELDAAITDNPTADAISLPVLLEQQHAPRPITAADILALQEALSTNIKQTSGALVDETLADALSSIRQRHSRPGIDSALIGAETGVARRAALEKAQQAAQIDLAAQKVATDIAAQNQGTQGGIFSQLLSGGLQGQQLLADAGESEIDRQFKEDLLRLEQEQQIRLQQMRDAAAQSQINQASRGQMVGQVVGAIAPAIFNQGRNPFEEYADLAKKYPGIFPSFTTNQSGVRNTPGMGYQMQTNDNQWGNFGGGSTMLDPFKPKFGAGIGL